MVASNELKPQYFVDTAEMIFELVGELSEKGIPIEFVNLGGGFGIPYRPEHDPLDIEAVVDGVNSAYDDMIISKGLGPLGIRTESGRWVTGPHGYLVTTAEHSKDTYRKYVGVDASMADLMRPGMYGAYHHVTVLGKEDAEPTTVVDVAGGLCENNDKFAIQRPLPEIEHGDLLVVHDAGAHGRAMGFNYNGRLRPAEVLFGADGTSKLIRRAETVDDLFATLVFDAQSINHDGR
jgi:diaminopimelate decarboxylase